MFKSRRFRLLFSSLLSLLVLISFGLSVSAASDDSNLINPDLSQWEVIDVYSAESDVVTWNNGELYRFYGKGDSSSKTLFQSYYDLGDIIAGHSYTFRFHLPNLADIQDVYATTMDEAKFLSYYNNATLTIGYGFLKPDGSDMLSSFELFTINSDNISAYAGKDLKTSFVAPSSSGRPCMFIMVHANDASSHYFFLQDFYLVDNDDSSRELGGIKGFLHSIRWDLVGGVCEDEDCPHSNSSDPHLSLSERMSWAFSVMFNTLSSKFESGSTLHTWFTNLSNVFNTSLTDSMNNTSTGFASVGEWFVGLTSDLNFFFDDLGADIKVRFDGLWDNMFGWLDKFKPRVYYNFNWYRGSINASTGVPSTSDEKPALANRAQCVVTDFFYVKPSDVVYLDVLDCDLDTITTSCRVYLYQPDGSYIEYFTFSSSEPLQLTPGYKYRFVYNLSADLDPQICNDYVLVYADEGWINAVVHKIEFGIKSLFIPDESFITSWKADFETLFDEHLGIVYDVGGFMGDFFGSIRDMLSETENGTLDFKFPAIELELQGKTVHLIDERSVDMSFLESNSFFKLFYGMYKIMLYVILAFSLFKYAEHTFERTMNR